MGAGAAAAVEAAADVGVETNYGRAISFDPGAAHGPRFALDSGGTVEKAPFVAHLQGSLSFRLGLIDSSRGIGLEHAADFVAHAAEDDELLVVTADGVCGIVEAPVMPVQLPGEHRAGLVRVAADSDDGLHRLVEELIQVLRVMAGNIEADLLHDLDRQWMDVTGGLRTGARHLKAPL